MMNSMGKRVSQRPVARTPCPEAHGEVSIAVCPADVQQHTREHEDQNIDIDSRRVKWVFHHLEYRSRENKQQHK